MTNPCNQKPYDIIGVADIDIDDLATPPDYFFGTRAIVNPESGNTEYTPVRIPGARVMPTGNLANVISLVTNNNALTIPEGQVRAGYIDVQPGGNIMDYADTNNKAQFLMVGEHTNGKMLIQSTGFLRINAGHSYLVSTQYYLGDNGEPVTESSVTGQKLFIPLDDKILLINGDF